MQYRQAKELAIKILKDLESTCLKIDIAGDVPHENTEVRDLIFFCLPIRDNSKQIFVEFFHKVFNLGFYVKGDIKTGYAIYHLPEAINLHIHIPSEDVYYYQLITYDASKTFIEKVDELIKEKGMPVSCETEYDFFSQLGITWQEPKNRN